MSDKPEHTAATPPSEPAPVADPSGKAMKGVVGLIVLSLIWYLLADRFTPYTQQARVQAYVVSVAAEASGRVTRVLVRDNQEVKAGDVLFEVDSEPFRIAVDRARADLESTRRQVGASTAGIDSTRASLRAAIANEVKARSGGVITDLRTEVGQFAAAGNPVMTLIAIRDVWISADMTENNLGHLEPGTPVSIVLDSLPGEVFQGRVRSIGYGVSVEQSAPPGGLPTVQNSRDWLRPAQRFPVIVEFEQVERPRLRNVRVGGQAEVMAFPGSGNPLNPLGRVFLRVMSWFSYLY